MNSIESRSQQQAQFETLSNLSKMSTLNDLKTPLWVSMSIADKLSFLLHQTNFKQFALLSTFLVFQYGLREEWMKESDTKLEVLLKSLIYLKFVGL
jgi:hypothetical protein